MRLTLVAHAETEGTRDGVFGDSARLRSDQDVDPWRAAAHPFCGPEPACSQTAVLLNLSPAETILGLAQPDFGSWQGRRLAEVIAQEPTGFEAWLSDAHSAPHGGESLAAMGIRVGATLDAHPWPDAGAVVIVSPFVARAALVHALGAPANAMLRADLAPLGSVSVSRHSGRWRLTGLHHPRERARR